MSVVISNLRDRPQFFDTVTDRVWRAWWEPYGVPRDYIAQRMQPALTATAVPFALVAHEGDAFAGTASVIDSDLDSRPQYAPWIAAVWVDPAYRAHRLGRALMDRAAEDAFAAGHSRVYLNARPDRRSHYETLGWTAVEENVGSMKLTVFVRTA